MRGQSPLIRMRRSSSPTPPGRGAIVPVGTPSGEEATVPPLVIPLARGLYQNNGASPWYTSALIGTPGQSLKIALDTGSNFIWLTSSLCALQSCHHSGGGRFVYQNSSSFQWANRNRKEVNFGPWGSMEVESGSDRVAVAWDAPVLLEMYLSAEYSGDEFAQLDWDGGIGIPSGSDYADPSTSFSVAQLMSDRLMNSSQPYVCFETDAASGVGSVLFGGIDQDAVDPYSGIFMPWTPYTAFPHAKYIWSTPLARYSIGAYHCMNVQFCLDSGSSQFKGDDTIMHATCDQIKQSPGVELVMSVGTTADGLQGEIAIPPDIYNVTIQGGPDKGKTLPQFKALGLTNLVLVGSVLLDQLYTVFIYDVVIDENSYFLSPVGMAAFNKKNGPTIIRTRSEKPMAIGSRAVHRL